jgi:hypothetical protein
MSAVNAVQVSRGLGILCWLRLSPTRQVVQLMTEMIRTTAPRLGRFLTDAR